MGIRWRRLTCIGILSLVATMLHAAPAHATVDDGPCSGNASGDFNGDGISDLAVGVPDEDLPAGDAGGVNVIYGSNPNGLTSTGNQFWTQDSTDVEGAAEAGDRFGACLASGDFDGNGSDDLAIAAPTEDIGAIANAGSVNILYGGNPGGLSATAVRADQIWHQDSADIQGAAESGDRFGGALAAGDFNGDGRDDLAVGVPLEDLGALGEAGAVHVLRGSASGLTSVGNQLWTQDSPKIEGKAEVDDRFGSALAAGSLNGDAFADLAIGAPGEDLGRKGNAGATNVIYGRAAGLAATGDQVWTQNSSGVEGASENDDALGRALAIGDFNGDGFGDLAMGAPTEDIGALGDAGCVNVLYGSGSGLTVSGNQLVTQDATTFTGDVSEAGDRFGAALAAGDYDASGQADLAIGVPFEDIAGATDAGAVEAVYGSGAGLAMGTNVDFWTQDSTDVEDAAEASDNFGSALTEGNFNNAGGRDLAIGVPQEDVTFINDGAMNVIYGIAVNGLDPAGPPGDQFWNQDVAGILDGVEIGDMFGSATS